VLANSKQFLLLIRHSQTIFHLDLLRAYKNNDRFVRIYLLLFVGGFMSYLYHLCLLRIVVYNSYCLVYLFSSRHVKRLDVDLKCWYFIQD
jgi:hypothetical protein